MVWGSLKVALVGASAVALISTVALVFVLSSNRGLAKRVERLEEQVKSEQSKAVTSLREKCASQAHLRFVQLGYNDQGGGSSFAIYSNHYSQAFSRCFMTLQTTTFLAGSMTEEHFLFDAYEQRTYAEATQLTSKDVGPFPRLMVCRLVPSSTTERHCATMAEYDRFVANYMEH